MARLKTEDSKRLQKQALGLYEQGVLSTTEIAKNVGVHVDTIKSWIAKTTAFKYKTNIAELQIRLETAIKDPKISLTELTGLMNAIDKYVKSSGSISKIV